MTDPAGISELVRALDHDEFVVYYQPQVRMEDGAIIGAEALLRWEHPQRGVIGPDLPVHGFLGHLIGAGCPGRGGVHDQLRTGIERA